MFIKTNAILDSWMYLEGSASADLPFLLPPWLQKKDSCEHHAWIWSVYGPHWRHYHADTCLIWADRCTNIARDIVLSNLDARDSRIAHFTSRNVVTTKYGCAPLLQHAKKERISYCAHAKIPNIKQNHDSKWIPKAKLAWHVSRLDSSLRDSR